MNGSITKQQIQDWLVQKISTELEVPIEEVDVKTSITDFGVDSITMVRLSAELGDFIDADIEPTALYKYHTIEAITDFIYNSSIASKV